MFPVTEANDNTAFAFRFSPFVSTVYADLPVLIVLPKELKEPFIMTLGCLYGDKSSGHYGDSYRTKPAIIVHCKFLEYSFKFEIEFNLFNHFIGLMSNGHAIRKESVPAIHNYLDNKERLTLGYKALEFIEKGEKNEKSVPILLLLELINLKRKVAKTFGVLEVEEIY